MPGHELYRGQIIEESLADLKVLSEFTSESVRVTNGTGGVWTTHTVLCQRAQLDTLKHFLRPGPWYAHFWRQDEVVVVYRTAIFEFDRHEPRTWSSAIEYGLRLGIPVERLIFPIEDPITH